MASSQRAKVVKCPYYEMDDKEYIRCEGITDDCRTRLSFINSQGKINMDKNRAYAYILHS